jgi:tellurite resistance protein TerB
MSFLAGIQKKFEAAKAKLANEMSKLKNADAANASLAIVALVAGADGEVEPEERKAGANFVRQGELFKAFDRAKLAETLEAYYAKATNEILKEDLFDVIRKVKGDADVARTVVKVGIGIANADGEFEPQEKDILREVCQALNLNAADFRGLAA